jgi:hypothetical protein
LDTLVVFDEHERASDGRVKNVDLDSLNGFIDIDGEGGLVQYPDVEQKEFDIDRRDGLIEVGNRSHEPRSAGSIKKGSFVMEVHFESGLIGSTPVEFVDGFVEDPEGGTVRMTILTKSTD